MSGKVEKQPEWGEGNGSNFLWSGSGFGCGPGESH